MAAQPDSRLDENLLHAHGADVFLGAHRILQQLSPGQCRVGCAPRVVRLNKEFLFAM